MIYELRNYETFNHNKKAFHERFEQHAMRIMKNYGFKVVGCWDEEIGDMQNFTYILAWKDLNARQKAWEDFNLDEEWSRIMVETAKKHGQLVWKTHNKILKPTKYSPIQ
ncbi:NIPSNAP family protein [Candidatus Saccharibacteria bacterium]|nr:NIPSNAP family protein [Candidatus Saccharibacteria bacterium]